MDKPKKLTALAVERAKYQPLHANGSGKLLVNRLPHEKGLYLAITPNGAKSWRYDFRFNGKRQVIVYGQYPEVSLKQAEEKHIDARRLLAEGKNPAAVKQAEKDRRASIGDNSFKAVGEEWYAAKLKAQPNLSDAWKGNNRRWLDQAYKAFGSTPLPDIEAADVLKLVKSVEADGYAASAEYLRQTIAQVFHFGILNLRAPKGFNPAEAVRGAVIVPPKKHHAKLDRDEIRPFIAAVDASSEPEDIKLGLKLLLHCFPRRTELTLTPWSEIQDDTWTISAERMKKDREHIIPLSTQARAMFARLKELAKDSPFVFPSPRDPREPRGKEAFNHALHRLGFKGIFSPHGVRATAASILAERGYSKDVVDAQLAHADDDDTHAAYFRATYIEQRRKMMEEWSQMIDGLCSGAKVIPIGAAA